MASSAHYTAASQSLTAPPVEVFGRYSKLPRVAWQAKELEKPRPSRGDGRK
jgi:hypothetical protein